MPEKSQKIYASELGINLKSHDEVEYFKWFLACLLFGKPVQQQVAKRAYLELVQQRNGIASPEAILDAGWHKLVEILDEAHYVRYDFSTATKLLDISRAIKDEYGTFGELLRGCMSAEDVSQRLQRFKGVGPKTAEIFLRDMAPVLEMSHSKT